MQRLRRLAAAAPTPTFQYSSGTNASISRSRSTISRSATDCTRPGAQAERELGPDQRRDVVADDAVEHAARALRVVKVLVEVARVVEPVLDALLGDLVELDALHLELRALELLGDVPGDRLALAIGVGGEQERVGLLGLGLELGQDLLLALDDLVGLLEALLDVDAHLLGQVFDVALGGQDLVARPEVLLDRLGLGRRSTTTSVFAIRAF